MVTETHNSMNQTENKNNEPKITLRSEEVQEIMGAIPPWIIRWGITLITFIVIGVGIGSYFFRYPDKLEAEVKILSATPPAYLSAQITGTFGQVTVHNKQRVKAGQLLAVISNPACTEDVERFSRLFTEWEQEKLKTDIFFQKLENQKWKMGILQNSFTAFYRTLNTYLTFKKQYYYPQKIKFKQQQINKQEELYRLQQRHGTLTNEQTDIARRIFWRDSVLRAEGIASDEEYDRAMQTFLQHKQTEIAMHTTTKQMDMQGLQNKESLLDLRQQDEETRNNRERELQIAAAQIKVEMEQWERNYLLKSPIDGIINMTGEWTDRQVVTQGDPVFVVIPTQTSGPVGHGLLAAEGAGKVQPKQRVYVRISDFPDMEFGFLEGEVKSVSEVPDKNNKFFIEIAFPEGLKTHYGKQLPPTKQMTGTAEIVIKEKRLIERLLQPIEQLVAHAEK